MQQHLESKTVVGLLILLGCILVLAAFGKLNSDAVEALKWIGGTYFAVRTVANLPGNQPPSPPAV